MLLDHYRTIADRLAQARRNEDGPVETLEAELLWLRSQMTVEERALVDSPKIEKLAA